MNPMRPTPKLTVLLVTYNHECYIDQALESLFRQDFSGHIELVVADDASNDATLARIRRHEGRDDRFVFKYLGADTNVGITRNYQRGFAACNSEFVAVLEGDDHWCSPHKLSRQVAFSRVIGNAICVRSNILFWMRRPVRSRSEPHPQMGTACCTHVI